MAFDCLDTLFDRVVWSWCADLLPDGWNETKRKNVVRIVGDCFDSLRADAVV